MRSISSVEAFHPDGEADFIADGIWNLQDAMTTLKKTLIFVGFIITFKFPIDNKSLKTIESR